MNYTKTLTIATLCLAASEAIAVESTNQDTLNYGGYNSPVWTDSSFNGSIYRNFWGGYLYTHINHTQGAIDTAIQTSYSATTVDAVKNDYWVGAKYIINGNGDWYMGPKLSVNWDNNGHSDDATGWYENYVVERANKSPQQFESWNQFWAVRQYDPGTEKIWTPVKKILKAGAILAYLINVLIHLG